MKINKFLKLSYMRWVLFGCGFLLLVTLVVYYGPSSILAKLKNISVNLVCFSASCIVFSTVLGALNVYILLGQKRRLKFLSFLKVYWFSWAMGLVVPGQIGDLATISLVLKKRGMDFSVILGRAVVDKVISLLVMMSVAMYGLLSLLEHLSWIYTWQGWLGGGLIVSCCFALWYENGRGKMFDPEKDGWLGEVGRTVCEFVFVVRNEPNKIMLNGLITLIKICLIGCAYWLMFAALGHNTQSLVETISLATLAGMVAYLPISLNGVGTVEVTGIVLFGQLGIPSTEVLTAYLLLRFMVLILAWLPSILWFFLTPQPTKIVSVTI